MGGENGTEQVVHYIDDEKNQGLLSLLYGLPV